MYIQLTYILQLSWMFVANNKPIYGTYFVHATLTVCFIRVSISFACVNLVYVWERPIRTFVVSPWSTSWIPDLSAQWQSPARSRTCSPLLLFSGHPCNNCANRLSRHVLYMRIVIILAFTKSVTYLTLSLTRGWPLLGNRPGWSPWEKGRTQRCPRSRHEAAPAQREGLTFANNRTEVEDWRAGKKKKTTLTLAMSQTVTRSQAAAKSKLCTLFFTLRAILQSPQPKSATTREGGLK